MHTLKAMALAIGSGLVMLPGAWAANSLQVVCASDKGGECYASFAYDTTAWNFGRDARFEWEGRNIVMTPLPGGRVKVACFGDENISGIDGFKGGSLTVHVVSPRNSDYPKASASIPICYRWALP
ncbi:hypothetical protein [Variovorax paradoxus]|jgi:hypothetical protein|uniref:hypothetical protein n=1 Tax=Variovorax paradoxus TaxID=34073 RepID=UPI000A49C983